MHRSITIVVLTLITFFTSLADQANILNNGGFETGLMCYQNWMWSQTGQDFKGDYKFNLSSDSHSGSRSLEIACAGADCLRAAVYSNKIPTTAGQAYKLSLYAKCPANSSNFIYIPNINSQNLICDGTWRLNQMSFQTPAGATNFFFYLFNASTSWLRVDDVVLTYADGTAPPHTVQYPGVRPVSISGQNVNVDGKPYLSLGFVNVSYNDLPVVAGLGANTVNGLESYSNADCFNAGPTSYLDRAFGLGLNFLPDSTTTARLANPSVFPTVIQTFAPHQAVLGWSIADEPDLIELPVTYISPATLTAEYAAIKSATSLPVTFDSQHAAYDTAAFEAPYAPAADIWMAEPYGADFGSVAHAASIFNSIKKQPVWLYQDAIAANLIVPKAYWAILQGVTGIHYFDWDAFKADSTKVAAAQQVFTELNSLKPAIFGANMDSLLTPFAGVSSTARYDSATDSLYVIAVKPMLGGSAANVTAKFTLKGLPATQNISVLFENRTISATAGVFTDTFTGASRHVYLVSHYKGAALGAPLFTSSVVSRTGRLSNQDWKLQISNTGTAVAQNARIESVSITESGGKTCSAALAGRNLPLTLGTIAAGSSAPGDLHLAFTGCDLTSLFSIAVKLSANAGAYSQTVTLTNQPR